MLKCAIIWTWNIAWWYDDILPSIIYSHAWWIRNFDELELWAVYSPINDEAEVFAKKWNSKKFFNDFKKFIIEINNYDIVVICSPTKYHYHQLIELLDTNVKIIIDEKPPVNTIEELKEIIEINKIKKKKIIVNLIRHFDGTYTNVFNKYWKQLWNVTHIVWYYKKWFLHNAIHLIDLIKHFLSISFDEAEILKINNRSEFDIEWDIRLISGNITFDLINLINVKYTLCDIDIFFENWKIRIIKEWKYIEISKTENSEKFIWCSYLESKPEIIETNLDSSPLLLYNNVINHLKHWEKISVSIEDTLEYYLLFNKILWN